MSSPKNKLKIAMLGHKRIPSREGGVEVVVEELSQRMVQKGCSVTCYNRKGHHVGGAQFDSEALKEYKGIRLKTVCTIQKRGLAAMSASLFAAICAAFGRYDVVHFHAEGPCAMLWLPKLFGKKCIATIHGLDHKRAKWGKLASAYILAGEKCAVRFADEIIVLSESAKRYFSETYGRETTLIPNGVSRPQNCEADIIKKEYGLSKDSYILFLGRLVPEKGVQYLIEAYKNIKTDKKLVIAGSASDSGEFESELHRAGDENPQIIFTGFVEGQILEELFSNAYIYVLPSDVEGMPLSLLEAMSYGNCCLTSDIEECASVVEDKGITFSKGNSADLANKLQLLCDSQEVVLQYREQSAQFVCDKYNWDKVTDMTLDLYR